MYCMFVCIVISGVQVIYNKYATVTDPREHFALTDTYLHLGYKKLWSQSEAAVDDYTCNQKPWYQAKAKIR